MKSLALVAIVALVATPRERAADRDCPAAPTDGAACPTAGLVCRYPKRGVVCECESRQRSPALWICGELGE